MRRSEQDGGAGLALALHRLYGWGRESIAAHALRRSGRNYPIHYARTERLASKQFTMFQLHSDRKFDSTAHTQKIPFSIIGSRSQKIMLLESGNGILAQSTFQSNIYI